MGIFERKIMKKRTKEEENEYRKALRAKKKHPTDVPPTAKNIPPVVKDVPPRDENVPPSIPPIDRSESLRAEAKAIYDRLCIEFPTMVESERRRLSLPFTLCQEVCYDGKPLAQAMKEAGL